MQDTRQAALLQVTRRAALPLGLAALAALGPAARPAHAQAVTIGAPGDPGNGNALPFGNTGATPNQVYQQVYNRALFAGPLVIRQIAFFQTNSFVGGVGGTGVQPGAYTFSLSTTAKAVNGLDTANFAANVGPNRAAFFSGTLGGPVAGGVLSVSGPGFLYDPAAGNLLLEIDKTGTATTTDIFLDARNGSFGTDSSRAGTFESQSATGYGLVTRFSAAPEPPAPAGPALGALALAGLRLRARRRRA